MAKKGLEPVMWIIILLSLLLVSAALYLGFIRPALSQGAAFFGRTTIGIIGEDIEEVAEEFRPVDGGLTGSLIGEPPET